MNEQKNTITINTAKFGELEISKDVIFNFVSPIIGLITLLGVGGAAAGIGVAVMKKKKSKER